jgi:glycerol-1-phosphate dehydrogenase [NAD(P)+]
MSKALLDKLLAGTLRDPDGVGMLSVPVKTVVLGHNLAPDAADLVAPLSFGNSIALVMDPQTRAVMGEGVAAGLRYRYAVNEIVFRHSPHPDMDAVAFVRARSANDDGVVAVGSGSINDIAKHAAHIDRKPYAVFGTAPSMNGYTSVAAPLTEGGLKKSLASTAPLGVFLDLGVLARAPKRLIAAGIGDSVCRATAQVDWLMAHLLLDTPYREAPFMLLAEDEEALLGRIGDIISGDEAAIEVLARTLVMSGFGMTICGGSYPASQGEHLIAHYIDMLGQNLPAAYHGEHIAVTTTTMAALQERILSQATLTITPSAETLDDFTAHFGDELGRECWKAWLPKHIDAARAASLTRKLAQDWDAIRDKLKRVGRPAADIGRALNKAGAPTTPDAVGIPKAFYNEAILNARLIRDRFTMLDLAFASGLLNVPVADAAFGAKN